MATPLTSSTNSFRLAVGLGSSPPAVLPVYAAAPGMFESRCLEAAAASAQPLHAGPALLAIPGMSDPSLPFANPHSVPQALPQALACMQAPLQQKLLTPHLDIPVGAAGLSSSLLPQAECPVQVEDLDANAAAPPDSPSSPPSPREFVGQADGPADVSVCLFQLAGERFYLRDWVRLKSSGEHDWIAQIVAYIPAPNSDSQAVDPDDDTGDGGRILCRWGWDPRDLRREACPALPLQSYSRFEVIPAINFCDENPIQSIKAKVRVERFDRWRTRTSYPPLVRCPADDEDEAEKFATSSSFAGVPMPSVMFYRHCHEIDTGFHPSLVADVVRFKRLSGPPPAGSSSGAPPSPTSTGPPAGPDSSLPLKSNSSSGTADSAGDAAGLTRRRSGVPEDLPRYRRYPSARNPDVRHFFCCHCQGTFAPPDDVPSPPFPEAELDLSSSSPPTASQQCLSVRASFHPALAAASRMSSLSSGQGSLVKSEGGTPDKGCLRAAGPPGGELQALSLEALEASSSDEPVLVLHPVQFPFVWKRFPAEGDFVVLCWKCKNKRKRRAERKREQLGEGFEQKSKLGGGVVGRRRRRGEEDDEEHQRDTRSGRRQKSDKDQHALQQVSGSSPGGRKSAEAGKRAASSGGDLSDHEGRREGKRRKRRKRRSRSESESEGKRAGDGQAKSSEDESEGESEAVADRDRKRSQQEDHHDQTEGWNRRRRKAASGVARAAQAAMAVDSSDFETEGKNESDADFVISDDEVHDVEADTEKELETRDSPAGSRIASPAGGRGGDTECRTAITQQGKRVPTAPKDAEPVHPNAAGVASKKPRGKEKSSPSSSALASGHQQRPRSDLAGGSGTRGGTPPAGGASSSLKRGSSGAALPVGSLRPGGLTDWQSGSQTRIERLAEAFRMGLKEFEEATKEQAQTGPVKAAGGSLGASGVKTEHIAGDGSSGRPTHPGGCPSHNGDADGGSRQTTSVSTSPSAGLRFSDAETCAKAVNAAFMAQHKGLDSRRQKQRFFELLSNLKRDNNQELRRKVLTGAISVNRLVKMESAELAPSFVRKEREEERERHFRQAVLLHEAPAAALARLRKTHKGIEPVIEDPDLLQACPPLRGPAPPIVDLEQKRRAPRRPREKVRLCESSTESSSSTSSSDGSGGTDADSAGTGSKPDSGSSSSDSSGDSSGTSLSSDRSSSSEESDDADQPKNHVKKERGGKGKESRANAGQAEKESLVLETENKGGSTSPEIQEQLASLKRFFSKNTTGNGSESSAEGSPAIRRAGVADGSAHGAVSGVKSEEEEEDKRGSTAASGVEKNEGVASETEGSRSRKEKRVGFAARVRLGDGTGRKIVKSKRRRSLAFQVLQMELRRLPELLPKRTAPDAVLEKAGGKKHNGKASEAAEKSDNKKPSSNNLAAPLDCSSFTPEACRDRVLRLLERVAVQGASPSANEAAGELNTPGGGKQLSLLDYKAVAGSMTRYLNLAFDRVTGEEHRKQGER